MSRKGLELKSHREVTLQSMPTAGSTVRHRPVGSPVTQTPVLNRERKHVDRRNQITMQFRTRGHLGFRDSSEENLFYNLEEHKLMEQTRRERNMAKVQDVKHHDFFSTMSHPGIQNPYL